MTHSHWSSFDWSFFYIYSHIENILYCLGLLGCGVILKDCCFLTFSGGMRFLEWIKSPQWSGGHRTTGSQLEKTPWWCQPLAALEVESPHLCSLLLLVPGSVWDLVVIKGEDGFVKHCLCQGLAKHGVSKSSCDHPHFLYYLSAWHVRSQTHLYWLLFLWLRPNTCEGNLTHVLRVCSPFRQARCGKGSRSRSHL